jgi:tetratricopeptide (TPR) repeat protein
MDNILQQLFAGIDAGDFEEAIRNCTVLISGQPLNPMLYELRGDCYFNLRKYESAMLNYAESIELIDIKSDKGKENLSALYNKKGSCSLNINNVDEALEDFKKAVKLNPNNFEAYNNKGKAHRARGEYKQCIDDCSQALEINYKYPAAYNNRGNAYYLLGSADESISDYNSAILMNPTYANAYYNRGSSHFILKKNYIEAKRDWEDAIRLDPSYSEELKEKFVELDRLIKAEEDIPNAPDFDKMFTTNVNEQFPELSTASLPDELAHLRPGSQIEDVFENSQEDEEQDVEVKLPESLLQLHKEIVNEPYRASEDNFTAGQQTETTEPKQEPESNRQIQFSSRYFREEQKPERSKSFYAIIGLSSFFFVVIAAFLIFYFLNINKPTETAKTENKIDTIKKTSNNLIFERADSIRIDIPKEIEDMVKQKNMILIIADSGFYLQAGSYKSEETALTKIEELEEAGFEPEIFETEIPGKGLFYRVRLGMYETLEDVKLMVNKLGM